MKKHRFVSALIMLVLGSNVFAQGTGQTDDAAKTEEKKSFWTDNAIASVGFTNTQLNNWAAGGYNTVTMLASLDANANYAEGSMTWNNHLLLDYGFISSADKPVLQKSNDQIKFESTWGLKATEKLRYSAKYNFRSQFSNSFKYNTPTVENPSKQDWIDGRILKSGLCSPAYTDIGLGIAWVPSNWLEVNLAPLTGGFTIVSNQELRPQYSMPKLEDGTYKGIKFEFGAKLTVDAKCIINDVFKYSTQLVLFSDYLDKPENMRVNWDNTIDWQIAKYFAITFKTYLIYDDNVLIDGSPKTQFKEYLMINFKYQFKPLSRK